MITITIACKSDDKDFIEEVKNQFDNVSISKDSSTIGLESWIMIGIALTQLTFQVLDFFMTHVNKNPDRQLETKDGRYTINCESTEELKKELEQVSK